MGKGFEIFSISIDENQENWKKAIAKDTLPWINTIDKVRFPTKELYNVDGVPKYLVVDNNGEVVMRGNLGHVSTMSKLKHLLKQRIEPLKTGSVSQERIPQGN